MSDRTTRPRDVDAFIRERIDTIPHLEALLLLWETRPRAWSDEELSERLLLSPEEAQRVRRDLVEQELAEPADFRYASSPERDALIEAVAATYRSDLIRVSDMVHAKAPRRGVRPARKK